MEPVQKTGRGAAVRRRENLSAQYDIMRAAGNNMLSILFMINVEQCGLHHHRRDRWPLVRILAVVFARNRLAPMDTRPETALRELRRIRYRNRAFAWSAFYSQGKR